MASQKRYAPTEKKQRKMDPFYLICGLFILVVVLCIAAYYVFFAPNRSENGAEEVSSSVSDANESGSSLSSLFENSSNYQEPSDISEGVPSEMPSDFEQQFAKNTIDVAFQNELDGAASTTAMINVYGKYMALWDKEVDNVYNKLKTMKPDNLEQIQAEQGKWRSSVETDIDEAQQAVNGDSQGNIALQKSKIAYDAYRNRAVALYRYLYQVDKNFVVGNR